MRKYNEIYKGNSEKYKGKIKNQDISVFGPNHNFVEYKMVVYYVNVLHYFVSHG